MSNSSPLEFSQTFELALHQIEQTPWVSLRLKQFNQLSKLLDMSLKPAQKAPFELELIAVSESIIRELASDIHPVSRHDPNDLEELYQFSRDLRKNENHQEFEYLIIEGWFLLGAHTKLVTFLSTCDWFSQASNTEELSSSTSLVGFQNHFLITYGPSLPLEFRRRLTSLMRSDFDNSSHHQVKGLFVVKSGQDESGLIANLTLEELKSFKKPGVNQLRIATHLVDENDVLGDQGHAIFAWLEQKHPIITPGHLRLEYTLSEKSTVLSGSSLGLGLAVLSQMALFGLNKNRSFEPRIYGDVAVTGALDSNGNVLPINANTLDHKLKVAFFSSIKVMVLPVQHQSQAQKILDLLKSEYPLRQLQLIFLGHIDELEIHREVFFYQRRKISRRVHQLFSEYANFVTISLMLFTMAFLAGFWFGIVKSPTPHSIETYKIEKARHFKILNKFGFDIIYSGPHCTSAKIADLDSDGVNEVLFGYSLFAEEASILICMDNHGKSKWKQKFGREISFGGIKYDNKFFVNVRLIHDFNHDGRPEIIVSAGHNYFPCQVNTLDFRGNIISSYWHSGHLTEYAVGNIMRDNESDELFVGGINNENRLAVVAVLDPFNMAGFSPQNVDTYTSDETRPGNQYYYLRFPPSSFNTKAIGGTHGDAVQHLSVKDGKVRVYLKTPYLSTYYENVGQSGIIQYAFSADMEKEFAAYTDNYSLLYERIEHDQLIEGIPNKANANNIDQIDYWDGYKWTRTPTMNLLISR